MSEIKKQLAQQINKSLGKDLVDETFFTDPPRVELGEFALPCFVFAKEKKQSPRQIARQMAEDLMKDQNNIWDNILPDGPYLNFQLKKDFWNKQVLQSIKKRKKVSGRKKVMIEFSQPNTHKQFHVGHLRNACLGASLVNLKKHCGDKVIATTYVNDVGLHVAQCLWNFMRKHSNDELPINKGKFLADVYAQAVAELKNNQEFQAEVSDILHQLEEKDKDLMKLWRKTRNWSLDEFKQIYSELNIDFDQWYYESEIVEKAKKIVKQLIQKKIAKQSEGAIIADLKKYDLDILVLLKSDGNTLYSTTDLALAYEKDKKGIDVSMYLVDVRQSLYLKQIFKVLELAGLKQKMVHIPYEFVKLPQGTMSSRAGNIIAYEDFRDTLLDHSVRKTKEKHPDWSSEKINQVAFGLAMSALKFGMLKYENNSVVVFDMDSALSFEGATGPYLMYTAARINSIVNKLPVIKKPVKTDYTLLKEIEEQELIKHLSNFDEVVDLCAQKNQPSYLCTYLIELAQNFNGFYHKYSIIKSSAKIQAVRIELLKSVKYALDKGLELLNIEVLEEM